MKLVFLGPVDHVVVGQRPRDDLPRRWCARWPRAATTCSSSSATCRGTRDNRDLAAPPLRRARRSTTACASCKRGHGRRSATPMVDRRLVRARRRRGRRAGCSETARGITAFYDIDTPVTLAQARAAGDCEYSPPRSIPRYDLYLSFTGGPTLERLRARARLAARAPLYCSVDPELYCPATRGRALGPRLPGHVQRRSPAGARAAAARAGARWRPGAVRRGRAAVSGDDRLAGERRADRAPRARRAPRLLQRAAVHAERHARRHGGRRLLAERAAVRGGRVRHADHQRRWPGSRRCSRPGAEILHRARRRRRARVSPRAATSERRAIGERAAGPRARRAHRGAPGARARGVRRASWRREADVAYERTEPATADPRDPRARRRGSTTSTSTASQTAPDHFLGDYPASSGSASRTRCPRT